MKEIEKFVDAGNVKFRSCYRDSIYNLIKDKDNTRLFNSISEMFYVAFSIGYHFNKNEKLGAKPINHVNLVSLDRDIKELMVHLILKRNPNITDPKELWKEVETYAEFGIQVLHDAWKNNNYLVIANILESN